MRRFMLSIVPAIALLSGCSAGQDIELAQGEVARFHQMLDSGRFAEIYTAAGPEIRNDMDQAEFVGFLTGVHNALGSVAEAKSIGWHVNYGTGGNRVTLTYDTRFARGSGQEEFVYDLAGNNAKLAGYHITPKAADPTPTS